MSGKLALAKLMPLFRPLALRYASIFCASTSFCRRSRTVTNDELGSLDAEDLSGVHLEESLFIDELAVELGHHELLADHHLVQGCHVFEIRRLLARADRRRELRAEVGRRGGVDCGAIHGFES